MRNDSAIQWSRNENKVQMFYTLYMIRKRSDKNLRNWTNKCTKKKKMSRKSITR